MNGQQPTSPVIKKGTTNPVSNLTFPEAMQKVIDGKKVTRKDWKNENTYSILKDGYLLIVIEGNLHTWRVSDGDMLATDWYVISEAN